jgi:hypothetical protein
MATCRIFFCLCAAGSAALPSIATAQLPVAANESRARPADTQAPDTLARSCVDPSDALARRWMQNEPCQWPRYEWPLSGGQSFTEPQRWPTYPPRSPETAGAHTMFWRFPVQPMGPYEVPRHSRR